MSSPRGPGEPDLPPDIVTALRSRPEDDPGWQVLADHLMDAGLVRGELAELDRSARETPWGVRGRAIRRRREALLASHPDLAPDPPAGLRLAGRWRGGFVQDLHLSWIGTVPPDRIASLLTHPSLRLVQSLTLDLDGYATPSALDRLLATRSWPLLSSLTVRASVWPEACTFALARHEMPALRELAVPTANAAGFVRAFEPGDLTGLTLWGPLEPLAARLSRHPGLERLVLGFYEVDVRASDVVAELVTEGGPAHLGLHGVTAAWSGFDACPVVRTLDLSRSDLGPLEPGAVAERVQPLELERLVVNDCCLDAPTLEALLEVVDQVESGWQEPERAAPVRILGPNPRGRGQAHRHWTAGRYAEARAIHRALAEREGLRGSPSMETRSWAALATLARNAGDFEEAAAYGERVVARRPTAAHLEDLALTRRAQGRTHHAEELFEGAIAQEPGRTSAKVELATVHLVAGKPARGLALLETTLEEDDGSRVHSVHGMCLQSLGRFAEAVTAFTTALERESDPIGQLPTRLNLAQCRWSLGEREAARDAYLRVAADAADQGIERFRLMALASLGHLDLNAGRLPEARSTLEECVPGLRAMGELGPLVGAVSNLGQALFGLGRYDAAEAAFAEALDIARRAGIPRYEALAGSGLGDIAIERGDLEVARRRWEEAIRLQTGLGDTWTRASTRTRLARALLESGDPSAARAELLQARADAVSAGNHRWAAWVDRELGRVAHAAGDPVAARALYRQALSALESIGDGMMIGATLLCLVPFDPSGVDRSRELLEAAGDRPGLLALDAMIAWCSGETPTEPARFCAWLAQLDRRPTDP